MVGFLWGEAPTLSLFAAEFLVPLALASLLTRSVRLPVLTSVGVTTFVVVCYLAYGSNRGGELGVGMHEAVLVAVLNALHFFPLWIGGSAIGWAVGRRRSGRNATGMS